MKTVYYFGTELLTRQQIMREVLYTSSGQRYDMDTLKRDIDRGEKVVLKKATQTMVDVIKLWRKIT